jgi:hypothetical protein
MANDKNKTSPSFPPSVLKLWDAVKTNTEVELKELGDAQAKYTRKTGMIEPDLDIGPTPYDPSSTQKKR